MFCVFLQQKKREIRKNFSLGTQSRDRTGMEVNPLVFETSASTNSAIWAFFNSQFTIHNAYLVSLYVVF